MDKYNIYAMIFFAGTIWGSFFYTLALRYKDARYEENRLKMLYEPSKCNNCGEKINYIFLIPVVGYLFSGGKCSRCDSRVSFLYPLAEIIYGLCALATFIKFGLTLHGVIIFFLISIALVISIIDFYKKTIPDIFVTLFLILSIYPVLHGESIFNNFYGFLLLFTIFFFIIFILPGSFGGGDLKYAAVLGFLVGLDYSVIVFEVALIAGSIYGILYGKITGLGLKIKVPFGPFLTLGFLTALFYGQEIVLWYSQFINF